MEDLTEKQLRLANITGRGVKANGGRRSADEVPAASDTDPFGAGARIPFLGQVDAPGSPVVVATELDRSFNRYVAAVTYGGHDVARALVDAGHATVSTE